MIYKQKEESSIYGRPLTSIQNMCALLRLDDDYLEMFETWGIFFYRNFEFSPISRVITFYAKTLIHCSKKNRIKQK